MPELDLEAAFQSASRRGKIVRVEDLEGGSELAPNPGLSKPYQFEWKPRHDFVVALDASGYKREQICRLTDYSYERVSVILSDPRAKEVRKKYATQLLERLDSIHDKLSILAHEALDELVDEMREAEDIRVRQKASLAILDRAGYTPVNKNLNVSTTVMAPETASRMEEALRESREVEASYKVVKSEKVREDAA